jgi:hypothetical protein
MMLTCEKCGRKHPLTEEDVAFFHPRFFCLSCGAKLPFGLDEAKVLELRRKNDPDRRLDEADLKAVAANGGPRKVIKTGDADSGGG